MMLVKKVVKWFLITNAVIIVLVIIIAPKQDKQEDTTAPIVAPVESVEQVSNEQAPAPEVVIEPEVKVETVEEMQARWDRGEFTAEEIAEIKAEEKREDAALKAQFE